MTESLDQLRKVAESATQTDWHPVLVGFPGREVWLVDSELSFICSTQVGDERGERDSLHIATFDPSTVLGLIDRAEAAEQAVDFHAQRDHELKTLLSMIADRLDESSYDELASLIEDEPLNQWSEKYTSKLQAAEAAVERAKAADALQRRDKGALYRRAEAAEAAIQRVREFARYHDDKHVTMGIEEALDGGEQK